MKKILIIMITVLLVTSLVSCKIGKDYDEIYVQEENAEKYIELESAIDDYNYEKEKDKLLEERKDLKEEYLDILSVYREISEEVTYEEITDDINKFLGKRIGIYGRIKEVLYEDDNKVEAIVNVKVMPNEEEKLVRVYHNKIVGVSKEKYKNDDLVMVFGIYMGQGKEHIEINSKFFRNASC